MPCALGSPPHSTVGAGGSCLSSQQSAFVQHQNQAAGGAETKASMQHPPGTQSDFAVRVTPQSYPSSDCSSLSLRASLLLLKSVREKSFQDPYLPVYSGHVSQISSVGPEAKLLSSKAAVVATKY